MGFNLFIPDINKKNSSKDMVINILTKNYPLTIKKIYNYAKKNYNYSLTYQSIFKAVNELLKNKVLIKNNSQYEINISWIKKLQSFTDIVETNYYAEKIIEEKNKQKENIIILNFESIFDAEKYLYYFVKNELKKMKHEEVIYTTNNDWKVFFYQRAEYNYYTKLMGLGHRFFFLSSGKTKVEKKTQNFYKKLGIKIRKKSTTPEDTIIFGNYFIQLFILEKTREKICKALEVEDELELINILDKKEDLIRLIIHKDKNLTNDIKSQILKKFKNYQ